MSRIIVVHCRDAVLSQVSPAPAHCFGPFDDLADALAFDAITDDGCHKWALDLVGPDEADIEASMPPRHAVHHDVPYGTLLARLRESLSEDGA
jgi:hypothetical protein